MKSKDKIKRRIKMSDKCNFKCPVCGSKKLEIKKTLQSAITLDSESGRVLEVRHPNKKGITIKGNEPMKCLRCNRKGKSLEFYYGKSESEGQNKNES
jgi:transcription elongation factor Elf1